MPAIEPSLVEFGEIIETRNFATLPAQTGLQKFAGFGRHFR